jgi:predicted acyl esterase
MSLPRSGPFGIRIEHDVRLPTGEPGVTLSADVYRPATDRPAPVLVTAVPYRKDYVAGATYDEPARWFATHGYASVVVDLRGTGASDGYRRPEFDPGDGDDAMAAIDWAAAQIWCDGAVGLWGMSYAANTTLRVASRRPAALRAIVVASHGLDAGRHSVHPDGARGDLHALANRGSSLLVQQLLPPLADSATPAAQARWHQRMHETEPAVLDNARHGPDSPVWTDRIIDGAAIVVPALCVGGWRDSFADGLIEAYERIRGPKRLLVGEWGHLLPHHSAFAPIDFLSHLLRWWDQWLRRGTPGVAAEPAVVLSLGPGIWRGYAAWPPGQPSVHLVAEDVGHYEPDPTIGALRGLPGLGLGEACPPRDQHTDDTRSVTVTGGPLTGDLVVGGRPVVTVRLDRAVSRIAVRLCVVDARGRSTVVSDGAVRPGPRETEIRLALRPVHRCLPAGGRLRVAISDADFPRLTPLAVPVPFTVRSLSLDLPVVPAGAGVAVRLPDLEPPPADRTPADRLTVDPATQWTVTREPHHDGVEVTVRTAVPPVLSRDGHRYHVRALLRSAVHRRSPQASVAEGTQNAEVDLTNGQHVTVAATVRCTQDELRATGEVTVDGLVVFRRTWHAPLRRETAGG